MLCEEKDWKNCQEFDDLVWINYQFINFVEKDNHMELQINLEGIESLAQNISKLSRTRKKRILYLGNCDWGNGRFACYTPFWYLDSESIRVVFLKLQGNEDVLRADFGESKSEELIKQREIYFEGTRKGLERLVRVLLNTKDNNQRIIINNTHNNSSSVLDTFLVKFKGRTH